MPKNVKQLLETIKRNPELRENVTAWVKHPPTPAEYRDIPLSLANQIITSALQKKGIRRSYSHQARAVATNALELGIDIGSLQSSVLVGYPRGIASTWRQMGRAGRGQNVSSAILIASFNPLDQHIINHPEYLFAQNPENALVNPENLLILVSQLKCAAFELPFEIHERFSVVQVQEILSYLSEHRIVHRA